MSTTEIDDVTICLQIELAATPQDALAAYDRWCAFKEKFKEMDRLVEQAMTAYVKEQGGSVDAGNVVYWLTHPKDWKCRSVGAALDKLIQASGGDLETLARDFLSVNAIKCGAARKVIGDELFECVVKDRLESGEALPKKLTKVDKTFLK